MKKIVNVLLSVVLALFVVGSFAGCTSRADKLVIRNWGDYMNPDTYAGFADWYKEKTGKTIKVDYNTYDTNEIMLSEVEIKRSDFDLVCPSDYMAEYMIKNGLVQELNRDIFNVTQEGLIYDGLMDKIGGSDGFDPENKYFAPYVWGTLGIMYDSEKITGADAEDMKSWTSLWDSKYSNKIYIKNSERDAYTVAQIYNNIDTLSNLSNGFVDYNDRYQAALEEIFTTATVETINQAKAALLNQKPLVYKYEVDDGKEDMLTGNTSAELGLFWSCDAGLIMNDESGNGQKFFYEVPKEGSNLWVDGWVIPTTAVNTEAANYFLLYLSETAVAKENMDWMGSSVASKSAMALALEEMNADEFEGAPEGFKEMYINMIFPDDMTLNRCKIMRDFGNLSTDLSEMWIDVSTK